MASPLQRLHLLSFIAIVSIYYSCAYAQDGFSLGGYYYHETFQNENKYRVIKVLEISGDSVLIRKYVPIFDHKDNGLDLDKLEPNKYFDSNNEINYYYSSQKGYKSYKLTFIQQGNVTEKELQYALMYVHGLKSWINELND